MTSCSTSATARPPCRAALWKSLHRTFCTGSSPSDGMSRGRRPVSRPSSAMRAERLDERTAAKVESASTRVPPAVANDAMVDQSGISPHLSEGVAPSWRAPTRPEPDAGASGGHAQWGTGPTGAWMGLWTLESAVPAAPDSLHLRNVGGTGKGDIHDHGESGRTGRRHGDHAGSVPRSRRPRTATARTARAVPGGAPVSPCLLY